MDLENVVKELHKLNFGENGLIRFASDGSDYNFHRLENGKHKFDAEPKICTLCGGCEGGAQFTRITHGTHTLDFLDAHGVDHDTVVAWSQKPVLFVMENPGAVDGGDLQLDCGRYISGRWYWVMGQYGEPNGKFFYPQYFVQKEYGWMIYSVIRTFKMANAYVTNMVKCGMKSGEKNYLTTDEYPNGIAQKCVEKYLKRELDCLRGGNHGEEVIVFAFGERTYYRLEEDLKDENISLYLLPHPANRLANDYRKYVLFGKILRGLLQNHFYDDVKEKPDFEAILVADVDENETEKNFEELCIEELERICKENGNYELKKRKSYDPNRDNKVVCYTFTVNADDETESLILRHATEVSVNETLYKVSWAEYRFDDKSIRLYAGKANSANVWIKEKDADKTKFPIYRIIKAFAEAYQTKYESPNGSNQG